MTTRPTHYSSLGRTTLCGKEIPFTDTLFTDIHELVTCKNCKGRWEARKKILQSLKAK